jgi:hypothetical protein
MEQEKFYQSKELVRTKANQTTKDSTLGRLRHTT